MRIKCDKCDHKVSLPDTSDALQAMKVHYAKHKGTKPKGKISKQAD